MKTKNSLSNITQIISDRIYKSSEQKITFAEYMNLALYHSDYGYYSAGQVEIGSQGDFFTSSSLGSDYGELLAEQFVEMWQVMDKPNPFMLVEMGAGLGFLAFDILTYIQNNYPVFFEVINYIIIEKSSHLIKKQKQILEKYINQINWHSWENIKNNSIVGCCFSNELVDAFPVHRIVIKNGQLKEIYVTVAASGFTEVIGNISTPKLEEYFKLVEIDLCNHNYPENYRTEVNLAALDWLKIISDKLKRGYLVTIDYGYSTTKYYHPQRYQGTLKCYYQHRHHDNPYVNVGQQDITTHVDFTALEIQGELLRLNKAGFTQQGMFLMSLGLGERLNSLRNSNYNLQELLSRRDTLHQLIDPTGLGGFGVLIQSKNLDKNITLKGVNFN